MFFVHFRLALQLKTKPPYSVITSSLYPNNPLRWSLNGARIKNQYKNKVLQAGSTKKGAFLIGADKPKDSAEQHLIFVYEYKHAIK